jgi:hypothetical protein
MRWPEPRPTMGQRTPPVVQAWRRSRVVPHPEERGPPNDAPARRAAPTPEAAVVEPETQAPCVTHGVP